MATSAFIIYTNAEGELRGTEIHHMGGYVPEQLKERFDGDFEALKAFIEVGRRRGGYSYATDAKTFWDDDSNFRNGTLEGADYCDYVFHVTEDFTFTPVRVEAVTTYNVIAL